MVLRSYVFECFVLHGSGEMANISSWNHNAENDFISIDDNISQPNVIFTIKYNNDGLVIPGFHEVKVLSASSLKDALRQIHIILSINSLKAYFISRYRCITSNNLNSGGSVRYISRPLDFYL